MLASLILGLAIALTIVIAEQTLIGGECGKITIKLGKRKLTLYRLYNVKWSGWESPLTIGAVVGVINYYSPRATVGGVPLVAPFGLVIMACCFVGLWYWWKKAGSKWKELIPFVLLAIMGFYPTRTAAWATAAITDIGFWDSLIKRSPYLLMYGTIGFCVWELLREQEVISFSKGGEGNE